MSDEHKVYWVGQQPMQTGTAKGLADDPGFVESVETACTAAGCKVQQFVSARGPYGTWLVIFKRGDRDQRILWDGRAGHFVLQTRTPHGLWDDAAIRPASSTDAPGFLAGVHDLLAEDI